MDSLGPSEDEIAKHIVDAAFHIHYAFGPGLLEGVYETLLEHELKKRGLEVQPQVPIPLQYDGLIIGEAFRADLIVNRKVIVELKAAEKMHPVYSRQLHTYLKISNLKLGLLINFGMEKVKDGIERIINGSL